MEEIWSDDMDANFLQFLDGSGDGSCSPAQSSARSTVTSGTNNCANCSQLAAELFEAKKKIQTFLALKKKLICTDQLIVRYRSVEDQYRQQTSRLEASHRLVDQLHRDCSRYETDLSSSIAQLNQLRQELENKSSALQAEQKRSQQLHEENEGTKAALFQYQCATKKLSAELEQSAEVQKLAEDSLKRLNSASASASFTHASQLQKLLDLCLRAEQGSLSSGDKANLLRWRKRVDARLTGSKKRRNTSSETCDGDSLEVDPLDSSVGGDGVRDGDEVSSPVNTGGGDPPEVETGDLDGTGRNRSESPGRQLCLSDSDGDGDGSENVSCRSLSESKPVRCSPAKSRISSGGRVSKQFIKEPKSGTKLAISYPSPLEMASRSSTGSVLSEKLISFMSPFRDSDVLPSVSSCGPGLSPVKRRLLTDLTPTGSPASVVAAESDMPSFLDDSPTANPRPPVASTPYKTQTSRLRAGSAAANSSTRALLSTPARRDRTSSMANSPTASCSKRSPIGSRTRRRRKAVNRKTAAEAKSLSEDELESEVEEPIDEVSRIRSVSDSVKLSLSLRECSPLISEPSAGVKSTGRVGGSSNEVEKAAKDVSRLPDTIRSPIRSPASTPVRRQRMSRVVKAVIEAAEPHSEVNSAGEIQKSAGDIVQVQNSTSTTESPSVSTPIRERETLNSETVAKSGSISEDDVLCDLKSAAIAASEFNDSLVDNVIEDLNMSLSDDDQAAEEVPVTDRAPPVSAPLDDSSPKRRSLVPYDDDSSSASEYEAPANDAHPIRDAIPTDAASSPTAQAQVTVEVSVEVNDAQLKDKQSISPECGPHRSGSDTAFAECVSHAAPSGTAPCTRVARRSFGRRVSCERWDRQLSQSSDDLVLDDILSTMKLSGMLLDAPIEATDCSVAGSPRRSTLPQSPDHNLFKRPPLTPLRHLRSRSLGCKIAQRKSLHSRPAEQVPEANLRINESLSEPAASDNVGSAIESVEKNTASDDVEERTESNTKDPDGMGEESPQVAASQRSDLVVDVMASTSSNIAPASHRGALKRSDALDVQEEQNDVNMSSTVECFEELSNSKLKSLEVLPEQDVDEVPEVHPDPMKAPLCSPSVIGDAVPDMLMSSLSPVDAGKASSSSSRLTASSDRPESFENGLCRSESESVVDDVAAAPKRMGKRCKCAAVKPRKVGSRLARASSGVVEQPPVAERPTAETPIVAGLPTQDIFADMHVTYDQPVSPSANIQHLEEVAVRSPRTYLGRSARRRSTALPSPASVDTSSPRVVAPSSIDLPSSERHREPPEELAIEKAQRHCPVDESDVAEDSIFSDVVYELEMKADDCLDSAVVNGGSPSGLLYTGHIGDNEHETSPSNSDDVSSRVPSSQFAPGSNNDAGSSGDLEIQDCDLRREMTSEGAVSLEPQGMSVGEGVLDAGPSVTSETEHSTHQTSESLMSKEVFTEAQAYSEDVPTISEQLVPLLRLPEECPSVSRRFSTSSVNSSASESMVLNLSNTSRDTDAVSLTSISLQTKNIGAQVLDLSTHATPGKIPVLPSRNSLDSSALLPSLSHLLESAKSKRSPSVFRGRTCCFDWSRRLSSIRLKSASVRFIRPCRVHRAARLKAFSGLLKSNVCNFSQRESSPSAESADTTAVVSSTDGSRAVRTGNLSQDNIGPVSKITEEPEATLFASSDGAINIPRADSSRSGSSLGSRRASVSAATISPPAISCGQSSPSDLMTDDRIVTVEGPHPSDHVGEYQSSELEAPGCSLAESHQLETGPSPGQLLDLSHKSAESTQNEHELESSTAVDYPISISTPPSQLPGKCSPLELSTDGKSTRSSRCVQQPSRLSSAVEYLVTDTLVRFNMTADNGVVRDIEVVPTDGEVSERGESVPTRGPACSDGGFDVSASHSQDPGTCGDHVDADVRHSPDGHQSDAVDSGSASAQIGACNDDRSRPSGRFSDLGNRGYDDVLVDLEYMLGQTEDLTQLSSTKRGRGSFSPPPKRQRFSNTESSRGEIDEDAKVRQLVPLVSVKYCPLSTSASSMVIGVGRGLAPSSSSVKRDADSQGLASHSTGPGLHHGKREGSVDLSPSVVDDDNSVFASNEQRKDGAGRHVVLPSSAGKPIENVDPKNSDKSLQTRRLGFGITILPDSAGTLGRHRTYKVPHAQPNRISPLTPLATTSSLKAHSDVRKYGTLVFHDSVSCPTVGEKIPTRTENTNSNNEHVKDVVLAPGLTFCSPSSVSDTERVVEIKMKSCASAGQVSLLSSSDLKITEMSEAPKIVTRSRRQSGRGKCAVNSRDSRSKSPRGQTPTDLSTDCEDDGISIGAVRKRRGRITKPLSPYSSEEEPSSPGVTKSSTRSRAAPPKKTAAKKTVARRKRSKARAISGSDGSVCAGSLVVSRSLWSSKSSLIQSQSTPVRSRRRRPNNASRLSELSSKRSRTSTSSESRSDVSGCLVSPGVSNPSNKDTINSSAETVELNQTSDMSDLVSSSSGLTTSFMAPIPLDSNISLLGSTSSSTVVHKIPAAVATSTSAADCTSATSPTIVGESPPSDCPYSNVGRLPNGDPSPKVFPVVFDPPSREVLSATINPSPREVPSATIDPSPREVCPVSIDCSLTDVTDGLSPSSNAPIDYPPLSVGPSPSVRPVRSTDAGASHLGISCLSSILAPRARPARRSVETSAIPHLIQLIKPAVLVNSLQTEVTDHSEVVEQQLVESSSLNATSMGKTAGSEPPADKLEDHPSPSPSTPPLVMDEDYVDDEEEVSTSLPVSSVEAVAPRVEEVLLAMELPTSVSPSVVQSVTSSDPQSVASSVAPPTRLHAGSSAAPSVGPPPLKAAPTVAGQNCVRRLKNSAAVATCLNAASSSESRPAMSDVISIKSSTSDGAAAASEISRARPEGAALLVDARAEILARTKRALKQVSVGVAPAARRTSLVSSGSAHSTPGPTGALKSADNRLRGIVNRFRSRTSGGCRGGGGAAAIHQRPVTVQELERISVPAADSSGGELEARRQRPDAATATRLGQVWTSRPLEACRRAVTEPCSSATRLVVGASADRVTRKRPRPDQEQQTGDQPGPPSKVPTLPSFYSLLDVPVPTGSRVSRVRQPAVDDAAASSGAVPPAGTTSTSTDGSDKQQQSAALVADVKPALKRYELVKDGMLCDETLCQMITEVLSLEPDSIRCKHLLQLIIQARVPQRLVVGHVIHQVALSPVPDSLDCSVQPPVLFVRPISVILFLYCRLISGNKMTVLDAVLREIRSQLFYRQPAWPLACEYQLMRLYTSVGRSLGQIAPVRCLLVDLLLLHPHRAVPILLAVCQIWNKTLSSRPDKPTSPIEEVLLFWALAKNAVVCDDVETVSSSECVHRPGVNTLFLLLRRTYGKASTQLPDDTGLACSLVNRLAESDSDRQLRRQLLLSLQLLTALMGSTWTNSRTLELGLVPLLKRWQSGQLSGGRMSVCVRLLADLCPLLCAGRPSDAALEESVCILEGVVTSPRAAECDVIPSAVRHVVAAIRQQMNATCVDTARRLQRCLEQLPASS